jgi:phenylalanyl-tRNA synthetase alpha chain
MLRTKIEEIKKQVLEELTKVKNSEALFDLEKKYLGRKSEFVGFLKNLKNLAPEERKQIGELANKTKLEILAIINGKKVDLSKTGPDTEKEKIDVTIPGKKKGVGHLNPISIVRRDIEDIFTGMGFEIADGPEVENEFYNFDALNVPKDHPARDMQDTFWLKTAPEKETLVLRTHTSNVQVRYMEKHKPPFRVIIPGKVFRNESTDPRHEHTFYQFEALVVGKEMSVANFKHIAEMFFSQFFKREMDIRLRPSYFPFTEPSFEFDITCNICDGKGCPTCNHSGWQEIGGAGMVNQKVFEAAGYKKGEYQGFAWGFGINRLAMLKYKIDDIRLFHSGDLRFTKQF